MKSIKSPRLCSANKNRFCPGLAQQSRRYMTRNHAAVLAAAMSAVVGWAHSSALADQTWDGASPGAGGGTGQWDNSTFNWNATGTPPDAMWAGGGAVFVGNFTAPTVTLSGVLTVSGSLTFNSSTTTTYLISNNVSASNYIDLTATSPTINVDPGVTAQLGTNSDISYTANPPITGSTLVFNYPVITAASGTTVNVDGGGDLVLGASLGMTFFDYERQCRGPH
jgi:hypothetical protein